MATMAFDTYKAVEALKDAGADESLARAMVGVVGGVLSENVAMKTDVVNLATKTDIAEILVEIRQLETRMTTRFVWIALGLIGITSGLTSLAFALLNFTQG